MKSSRDAYKLEALEPRLLLSGDPIVGGLDIRLDEAEDTLPEQVEVYLEREDMSSVPQDGAGDLFDGVLGEVGLLDSEITPEETVVEAAPALVNPPVADEEGADVDLVAGVGRRRVDRADRVARRRRARLFAQVARQRVVVHEYE